MKTLSMMIVILASTLTVQQSPAQDLPTMIPVSEEHKFLKKFVGTWDVESEGSFGEGQPTISGKAVMNSSMVGQLWVVNSSEMVVAGMKMKSTQMFGYDPVKEKYIGTYADSMVNHLWVYEGTVDETGKKLVMEAKGPNQAGDKMIMYRDQFEFADDDTIIATSFMQQEDGGWHQMMQGTAKRRKDGSK